MKEKYCFILVDTIGELQCRTIDVYPEFFDVEKIKEWYAELDVRVLNYIPLKDLVNYGKK